MLCDPCFWSCRSQRYFPQISPSLLQWLWLQLDYIITKGCVQSIQWYSVCGYDKAVLPATSSSFSSSAKSWMWASHMYGTEYRRWGYVHVRHDADFLIHPIAAKFGKIARLAFFWVDYEAIGEHSKLSLSKIKSGELASHCGYFNFDS